MSPEDFSSLRLCRSGGDKVPAELEKEFMALARQTVSEGYGMTEIGLAALNPRLASISSAPSASRARGLSFHSGPTTAGICRRTRKGASG